MQIETAKRLHDAVNVLSHGMSCLQPIVILSLRRISIQSEHKNRILTTVEIEILRHEDCVLGSE